MIVLAKSLPEELIGMCVVLRDGRWQGLPGKGDRYRQWHGTLGGQLDANHNWGPVGE